MKIKENYAFLALVCSVFVFGAVGLVKTENLKSNSENRMLARFEHFTLRDFLDGSFQDNFESALSDQFLFSEKIRIGYGGMLSSLPTFGLSQLVCINRYMDAPGSSGKRKRAFFNCEDYLVAYPIPFSELALKHIANYNRINSIVDTYYYYIENFWVFDFEKGARTVDYEEILKDNLVGKYKLRTFKINDFEEYKKYFYKTDHHWNYVGSYKGYLEIMEMLGVKDPVQLTETYTNHDLFYGSHSKLIQNYDSTEEFVFYDFVFPEHDTYVNGKKSQYNHYVEYKNGECPKNVSDYYHYVYGSDAGEVVFDYHQKGKENLLIITDSYGDAVKELIAQHFNKTYAVDLRHYKESLDKDFEIKKYINDNKIDKVLIMGSQSFLTGESLNQGLEL